MVPGYFFIIVLLIGVTCSNRSIIGWHMILSLFGGAAAITLTAVGGSTIGPATFFLGFILWRAVTRFGVDEVLGKITHSALFLLGAVAYGVIGAQIFPRYLDHLTKVLTVDRFAEISNAAILTPLHPVSGNITQSIYAIGNVLTLVLGRAMLVRSNGLERFRDMALLLGALNVGAALLNLAEFYLHLPPILSLFRTASYTVFETYEVGGMARISGTFSEASSWAFFTIPMFAYSLQLWLNNVKRRYSGAVAALSGGLLLLSTSTTAYIGLAAYLGWLAITFVRQAQQNGRVPKVAAFALIGLIAFVAISAVYVFELPASTKITRYLNATIFEKMSTGSAAERSSWNTQCWHNFVDTFGLGVGIGSARGSSFLLVLLSNVGLAGTLLYFGFLISTVRTAQSFGRGAITQRAAAHGLVATFCAGCASGGIFDLGCACYLFAAAATVIPSTQTATSQPPSSARRPWRQQRRSSTRPAAVGTTLLDG